MIRRNRSVAVGVDRWMVSWADLLTLLFASMVVLYASSVRSHLKPSVPRAPIIVQQPVVPPPQPPPPVNPLAAPFSNLNTALASEIGQERMDVSLTARGIVVSLKDQTYFTSGSDEVSPAAIESIGRIADVIRDLPNAIRLEGHSDSMPIHNRKFRDNWSLSAARSAAVLTLLESRFDIPLRRMAIAGYADNQPVSENESAEGRARNRRVDIVILSETCMKGGDAGQCL